jgi:hypothetical protein
MASPARRSCGNVIIARRPRRRGPIRTLGMCTKTASFGPPALALASIARQ